MRSGRNGSAPTLGLEHFMGSNKEEEYTMWKDKFLTYIRSRTSIPACSMWRRNSLGRSATKLKRRGRRGECRRRESAEPRSCFYCFEDGYRKKDCPDMAKDRDPKRPGGAFFHSNIQVAPSAKKKRMMMMTVAEADNYDQQLANTIHDADEFEFDENSEGEEAEDKAFN
ncbi:hypothetical protein ON010_g3482 [Phytophthora cinnamomi]|nr:hypothetical protein ON010_g3482 [Phytophthora cinnamomi]